MAAVAAFMGYVHWLTSDNDDSRCLPYTAIPQTSQSPPARLPYKKDVDTVIVIICVGTVHAITVCIFYFLSTLDPETDNTVMFGLDGITMFGTGIFLTYFTMYEGSLCTCRILSGCVAAALWGLFVAIHWGPPGLGTIASGWAWYWVGFVIEWRLTLICRFAVHIATVSFVGDY
ncbi:uncharacterized protein F4807DRAFT_465096 [Annulohypoxylon truncatum]|uniref:uncharacterized protein n=1 Tax=Annulohypoxylon truncatum TaxID=327061 RepID=UPI002007A17B|nr:uncharacterized protein F4807DRAFT_465096 [Annulohypoxylon truncatum]KAI1204990.1 hypothetical protein F4807DRAFT_465096 [Annulohypoxylon truncatum]